MVRLRNLVDASIAAVSQYDSIAPTPGSATDPVWPRFSDYKSGFDASLGFPTTVTSPSQETDSKKVFTGGLSGVPDILFNTVSYWGFGRGHLLQADPALRTVISTRRSFTRNNEATVEKLSSSPDTSPRYQVRNQRRSTTPEHSYSSAASSPPGTVLPAVGLPLAGWATPHAGVWRHWRRFVPFAIGPVTVALIGTCSSPRPRQPASPRTPLGFTASPSESCAAEARPGHPPATTRRATAKAHPRHSCGSTACARDARRATPPVTSRTSGFQVMGDMHRHTMSIEFLGLTKVYGDVRAVHKLDRAGGARRQ